MIPIVRRWDDVGALTLDGTVGSYRALMKATLLAAGWTVEWEDVGAQKLVMRNDQGAGGNDAWIRILDDGSSAAGAREAFMQVFESMTDIDTGTGPATSMSSGAGVYIRKSNTLDSTPSAYVVAADALRFNGGIHANGATVVAPGTAIATGQHQCIFGGGAPRLMIPSDPSVFVLGASSTNSANVACGALRTQGAAVSTGQYTADDASYSLSRDASLALSPTPVFLLNPVPTNTANSGHGSPSSSSGYPESPLPGYMGPCVFPGVMAGGGSIRGVAPGLFVPLDRVGPNLKMGDVVTPVGSAPSRSMIVVTSMALSANNAGAQGRLFIDTGDWDA